MFLLLNRLSFNEVMDALNWTGRHAHTCVLCAALKHLTIQKVLHSANSMLKRFKFFHDWFLRDFHGFRLLEASHHDTQNKAQNHWLFNTLRFLRTFYAKLVLDLFANPTLKDYVQCTQDFYAIMVLQIFHLRSRSINTGDNNFQNKASSFAHKIVISSIQSITADYLVSAEFYLLSHQTFEWSSTVRIAMNTTFIDQNFKAFSFVSPCSY